MAPPLLGAQDSFNSSSATIRPDNRDKRDRPHASSALGPQDSVGREFDALIGGRIGVLQSDTGIGNTEHLTRYLREYSNLSHDAGASTIEPTALNPSSGADFNPLDFVADPSGSDLFAGAELETNTATAAAFAESSSSPAVGTSFSRPQSAASHHSTPQSDYSYSTTEGSYATTDDDGDLEMFHHANHQPSPSPLNEIGQLNITSPVGWGAHANPLAGIDAQPATISPQSHALGSSSRAAGASADASGSGRRRSHAESFGDEDDGENARQARLEHRRSINRRSAQKHRLRRKEELEDLTHKLAERDARIKELEKDLAVTQAKLNTLMSLVKNRAGAGAGAGAGANP